jgi:hypothetical protein
MGGGRRGEKNLFFTHVHKITNAPFLYIKYKVIEVAQSLTLFCFLLPTHTTDTKNSVEWEGEGGGEG